MPIFFTDAGKQAVIDNTTAVVPEPLQGYMAYDRIVISNTKVIFCLKDKEMFYLDHSAGFERGELLTLDNILGYMPISLST